MSEYTEENIGERAIEVKHLRKSFGPQVVLEDVSFSVKKGEVIAVIGGSGCGKSVLLRCLEHLERPDSGEIRIDGELVTEGKRLNAIHQKVGMVYQSFNLFSNMNVMDNLCLAPCKLKHMEREKAEKKALEWLGKVGLRDKAYSMTTGLSGGQKQRIAIARCLMMDPEILLFDEPTSALDPSMVGEVLATIRMLSKYGITMMIVTHEMYLAQEIASRVFFLAEKGIYEQGTPGQIFEHPQKELTAAFVNRLKELHYSVQTRNYDLIRLQGEVITFAQKYGIDRAKTMRLQLCAEELIQEFLPKDPDKQPEIHLTVRYYEKKKHLQILLDSAGDPFDLFHQEEDLDHLGVLIIKKMALEYHYSYEDGINRVDLIFD